jgi:hypothetical protein
MTYKALVLVAAAEIGGSRQERGVLDHRLRRASAQAISAVIGGMRLPNSSSGSNGADMCDRS